MTKVIVMSGNKQIFTIIDLIKYNYNSSFFASNDISIILNKDTLDFNLNYISIENINKLKGIKSIHIKKIISKIENGDIKFYRSDRLNNNDFIFITDEISYVLKENANFSNKIMQNEKTSMLYKNKAYKIVNEAVNSYDSDLLSQIKRIPFYFQLLSDIEDHKNITFKNVEESNKKTLIEYYFEFGHSTKFSSLMEQNGIITKFINEHSEPSSQHFEPEFTDKSGFNSIEKEFQILNIMEEYEHRKLVEEITREFYKKHKIHNPRKNFTSSNNKKKIKAIRVIPGDRNSFIEVYGKSLNDAREYKGSTSYLIKDEPTSAGEIKSGSYYVEFSNFRCYNI